MARIQRYFGFVLVVTVLALFPLADRCYSQLPPNSVPLFQYAVFYNLNLEADPTAVMPILGPVFCTASIWSGTPNVDYWYTVEAVGTVSMNRVDPFVADGEKSDSGTPESNFQFPGQPVSGVVPITTLAGEPNLTNSEALINLPPVSVRAPQPAAYFPTNQAYTFNAVSLIISNCYWGTNGIKPWSNNFTVYLQDSVPAPSAVQSNGTAMNWIQLTNDYYIVSNRNNAGGSIFSTNYVPNFQFTNDVSAIHWTNSPAGTNSVWYAGYSFLTNVTFYDYREQATVRAIQVDIGRLGAWMTNATPNGGSNWNQELAEDTGRGVNSIFVYNTVPFIGQQQLPAVRLSNGKQLPSSNGLTVVTPQPLYVLGNYNVQIAGGQPVLNSHNTVNIYPAALMADAITVLSSNWSDAYKVATSLASRPAHNITINAACLTGIVPSSGANYSGGLENFFRVMENWDSAGLVTFTYNGSMAVMFPSLYATNIWPGTGYVYGPPDRDWLFDTNFISLANLPPLTPLLIDSNAAPTLAIEPANESALTGQSTNFTVTASGVPAVSYQWTFDGTNIAGATNDLLLLADVGLTNAGYYAVEISNVFGSVISSNAQLSVYATAAPLLTAFSFSTNGVAEFSVSGVPGFNYTVEASTNLVDWVPLTTSVSPFIFADTNANLPQRLYRGVYLP